VVGTSALACFGRASERPVAQLLARRCNLTKFGDQVLRPLLEAGLLEMTVPDKPRSPQQRYRTTEAGRRLTENTR